jgi:hypothetical protein
LASLLKPGPSKRVSSTNCLVPPAAVKQITNCLFWHSSPETQCASHSYRKSMILRSKLRLSGQTLAGQIHSWHHYIITQTAVVNEDGTRCYNLRAPNPLQFWWTHLAEGTSWEVLRAWGVHHHLCYFEVQECHFQCAQEILAGRNEYVQSVLRPKHPQMLQPGLDTVTGVCPLSSWWIVSADMKHLLLECTVPFLAVFVSAKHSSLLGMSPSFRFCLGKSNSGV